MVRTEIRLFLKNQPGELGKLALLLSENSINALSISRTSASFTVTGSAGSLAVMGAPS